MKTYRLQQANYQMRTYKYKGTDHLIVPVVMMREGVHAGSHGPLLHKAEELSKVTAAWNGQPVVIGHPKNEQGVYVSANLPDVREREEVGLVFNTRFEGDALKADIWLNINKMQECALPALTAIKALRPMDVSVGVYSDDVPEEGEWNGEKYTAIATNHRPDHLALLPGETGACSWADGCGIRTNKKDNEEVKVAENLVVNASNNLSFDQINRQLQNIVNGLDKFEMDKTGDNRRILSHWANVIYNDYFVYEQEDRKQNKIRHFKQAYGINVNDEVETIGEPIEVKREIIYTPIQQINNNSKTGGTKMTPCCKEKINTLITNATTPWSEKNREWLEGLDEPIIDNLVLQMQRKITAEEGIQVLTSGVTNANELVAKLPDSAIKKEIEAGLALNAAQRTARIEHILNNTKEVWTKEQLEGMSMELLENIGKSISTNSPVDYSVNGLNNNSNTNGEGTDEVLMPVV